MITKRQLYAITASILITYGVLYAAVSSRRQNAVISSLESEISDLEEKRQTLEESFHELELRIISLEAENTWRQ